MVAGIPHIYSALNFPIHAVLMKWYYTQALQLLTDFKGIITCLYVPILFKLKNAYSMTPNEHKDHQCINASYQNSPHHIQRHAFYSYTIFGYRHILFKN
jgi:hypothetical protein